MWWSYDIVFSLWCHCTKNKLIMVINIITSCCPKKRLHKRIYFTCLSYNNQSSINMFFWCLLKSHVWYGSTITSLSLLTVHSSCSQEFFHSGKWILLVGLPAPTLISTLSLCMWSKGSFALLLQSVHGSRAGRRVKRRDAVISGWSSGLLQPVLKQAISYALPCPHLS